MRMSVEAPMVQRAERAVFLPLPKKETDMRSKLLLIAASLAMVGAAFAQTKWDLPAAYPATNFHTENLTQFANDVDKAPAAN
jgi:hypothetical protein